MPPFEILFMDNHLLVVKKPAGMLVQGDKSGDKTLLDHAKEYLKKRFNKPGNVYLGLVHRLDRPVSGVVVLARTSKAASRLSKQIRDREVTKIYWALVQGKIDSEGKRVDYIGRKNTLSVIANKADGKVAHLSFRRLQFRNQISLIEIDLGTGRHHQIRLQLSALGFPILGDVAYGSTTPFSHKTIALHAYSITIHHPVKKHEMTFTAQPDTCWTFPQRKRGASIGDR